MNINKLKQKLEKYFTYDDKKLKINSETIKKDLKFFIDSLNNGLVRAVEKKGNDYKVNLWVKRAILLIFKVSPIKRIDVTKEVYFQDKELLIPKSRFKNQNIRLVPNSSCVREGAYIGKNCILMSPSYVNVGAYVDNGALIDSNALVGSCAQIGKNVHISAAAQIGGVLEPVGALPVIIEDDVLIGGNCGVYEGVIVGKGAVIASGVILTSGTAVYDLVNKKIYKSQENNPLRIPEGAVVVAGGRKISGKFAKDEGLNIYTPIIIKYKDEKTSQKVKIEKKLR